MSVPTPSFDSLPLKKDGPRGNAWGLFGVKDELGMLNRLTPENTTAAAKEIVHGTRVSTDLALDQLQFPCFNRVSFEQRIHHKAPRFVNDDILTLNTQSSSQWDGFRHYGYQDAGVYFNGCTQEEIFKSSRNGIHVWVENGGVVGRGILLDYAGWAASKNINLSPLTTKKITLAELKQVAEYQKISFCPNDILFIRSGYVKALLSLTEDEAMAYSKTAPPAAIGVESGEEMLRWIWENEFAAVAGDMTAFEAHPFQSKEYMLHEWLLGGWGMPIGELFDLEKLAEECRRLNKWTFFFTSIPLKVTGGIASPPNGVAIL